MAKKNSDKRSHQESMPSEEEREAYFARLTERRTNFGYYVPPRHPAMERPPMSSNQAQTKWQEIWKPVIFVLGIALFIAVLWLVASLENV